MKRAAKKVANYSENEDDFDDDLLSDAFQVRKAPPAPVMKSKAMPRPVMKAPQKAVKSVAAPMAKRMGTAAKPQAGGIGKLWQGKKVTLIRDSQSQPQTEEQKEPIIPQRPGSLPKNPVKRRMAHNIASIDIQAILQDTEMATGDPIFCQNCEALLNSFSTLVETPTESIWTCEFCDAENSLQLDPDEIPTQPKLKYILEAPAQQAYNSADQKTTIFCIDISGSMCVTSPIQGNLQLKTGNKVDQEMVRKYKQEGNQRMPGEASNITYVSRIECVQAAIESQIQQLVNIYPQRKLGIVTFSNDVTIIGDGTNEGTIAGDKLSSWDQISASVDQMHSRYLSRSIEQTKDVLTQKVLGLQEGGATALGPALLTSIKLACQGSASSEVIICTDGVANVGLGSLEEEKDQEAAEDFYQQVAQLAQDNGVVVSLISITDQECQLDYLSSVIEATGGELNKVDPQYLHENFANILSQQILATNVTVNVNMHKLLKIHNQEAYTNAEGTRLVKKLGNVTEDTEFYFEYSLISRTDLQQIPMQLLMYYTRLDGMKCVLAHTDMVETSSNQQEIEQEQNVQMIAKNYRMQSAQMVKNGQFREAQKSAYKVQNYAKANADHQLALIAEELNELGVALEEEKLQSQVERPSTSKKRMSDSMALRVHKMQKKSKY